MRHHIPEPDTSARPIPQPWPERPPGVPARLTRVIGPDGDEQTGIEVRCAPHLDMQTRAGDRPPGPPPPGDDVAADAGREDTPARPLSPASTLIADVMTRDPVCLHGRLNARLAANLFIERRIGGAPVVDDAGVLIGILSKTDLVRERVVADRGDAGLAPSRSSLGPGFHVDLDDDTTVEEIMTPASFGVGERTTLAQALALMSARRIDRLVVLDDGLRVAGVLTASDVVRWAAGRRDPVRSAPPEPTPRVDGGGPMAEPPIRGAVPR